MSIHDYIVVGSGCSGAMAAQTLVEAGKQVLMVDVGVQPSRTPAIPDEDYLTIRRTDIMQSEYLIGPNGEGIGWGKISKGAQITPPRQYMSESVEACIPYDSENFSPLESLGYGGLGIGWGLQCWEYSDADLRRTGLNVTATRKAYQIIANRIGVSASRDLAADYTIGLLEKFQPAASADRNHKLIQRHYQKHFKNLQRQGLYVGRTPLALITEDKDDRKGYQYHDMDFYSDNDRSAWRPWITVNTLKKTSNFEYRNNLLVLSFSERDDIVTIRCLNLNSHQTVDLRCRKLVLATSALGSARIAIRSLGDANSQVSLLSNPHTYISCVQPRMLGKGSEENKLGFGQLSYFLDETGDDSGLSIASSYGYQSLMLFRIINQIPLNLVDARSIARYLLPALVIMIVQHPDVASSRKSLLLVKDTGSLTGDKLKINYELTAKEEKNWNQREKRYMSMMRKLGTYPIKRVHPDHGSGIHYAGTLPFKEEEEKLYLSPHGRLYGTQHVYVADSSGFQYLPAKGLTFTLMANAHITAENVLNDRA